MLNKLRLMSRYYLTLLVWPLRSFWRWGMFITPGIVKPRNVEFSVDQGFEDEAPDRASIVLQEHDVFQLWKAAYLAKTRRFSVKFSLLGKVTDTAKWFAEGQEMDDEMMTEIVVCDRHISLEGSDDQSRCFFTGTKDLDAIFDHFGLPSFKLN